MESSERIEDSTPVDQQPESISIFSLIKLVLFLRGRSLPAEVLADLREKPLEVNGLDIPMVTDFLISLADSEVVSVDGEGRYDLEEEVRVKLNEKLEKIIASRSEVESESVDGVDSRYLTAFKYEIDMETPEMLPSPDHVGRRLTADNLSAVKLIEEETE